MKELLSLAEKMMAEDYCKTCQTIHDPALYDGECLNKQRPSFRGYTRELYGSGVFWPYSVSMYPRYKQVAAVTSRDAAEAVMRLMKL